jgi:nitrogen regulatory protein P-II 1
MVESTFYAERNFKLIIAIVKKGMASRVVAAGKRAGAKGGTILLGRGTAKKSVYLDLLGINFEPEKEIILTFVEESKVDVILQAVVEEGKLDKPGNGIAFVVNMKCLAGVSHLLKTMQAE